MQKKIQEYTERIENYGFLREARTLILDSFFNLHFRSLSHEYFLPYHGSKIKLPSVSKTIHQFQKEQNWDSIALNYALSRGRAKEDVLNEWKWNNIKSTNSGSNVHNFGEACFYFYQGIEEQVEELVPAQFEQDWLFPNSPKEEAVISFWEEEVVKKDNIIPILSESKVYTLKYMYAGTFDLLFYDLNRKGFVIRDYKTNKDLYKNFNLMLQSPFEDLLDCDYSLYTLQLSAYQIPLEDIGINVIDREIIWLKEDGTYQLFSLENETKRLKEALKN